MAGPRRPPDRAAAGAVVYTLAAQAISSLTNFTVNAVAFVTSRLSEFGQFSIALQLCQIMISAAQGGIGNATLIHGSVRGNDNRSPIGDASAATAAFLGIVLAVPVLVAWAVIGGQLGTFLLIAAIGAPALVSQYVYRARLYSQQNTRGVVIADTIWLVVLLVVTAANWLFSLGLGPAHILAAWLFGAAVSASPLLRLALRSPIAQLKRFWQLTGPQAIRTGAEGMLARSIFVVSLVAVREFLGDSDAGSLAAAALAFSPLSIINSAIPSFVVPTQVGRNGIHVVKRSVPAAIIGIAVGMTVLWGITLLVVQNVGIPLGPFDLSAGMVGTGLFLATALRFVAMAAWQGPLAALRVADASQVSLRVRAVATVVQWVAPVVSLIVTADLVIAATALAVATLFGPVYGWSEYEKLGRSQPIQQPTTPEPSGAPFVE